MSDDVPQIPMPAPVEQRPDMPPPPEGGFTRQLTPEEEREVLIQFMGGQYGEMHKMDQAIVGSSSTLTRGKSEEVKQQITQLLQQPAKQVAPQPPPPVPQSAPVSNPAPVSQPNSVPVATPVAKPDTSSDSQLTFNFDVDEKQELLSTVRGLTKQISNLRTELREQKALVEKLVKKQSVKKKSVEIEKK